MRKLVVIIVLPLLLASCSLFQKPTMSQEEIDNLLAENKVLKAQAGQTKELEDQLALTRMQVDEAMLKLAACEEGAKDNVHIIVGAFKTASYADAYSALVKSRGMDGNILAGPYSFSLVTAHSYESIQSALNSLGEVRENQVENAWLYME
ncbi:MAG: hypothetical protein R2751_17635 [Bacteroidales bacterium]